MKEMKDMKEIQEDCEGMDWWSWAEKLRICLPNLEIHEMSFCVDLLGWNSTREVDITRLGPLHIAVHKRWSATLVLVSFCAMMCHVCFPDLRCWSPLHLKLSRSLCWLQKGTFLYTLLCLSCQTSVWTWMPWMAGLCGCLVRNGVVSHRTLHTNIYDYGIRLSWHKVIQCAQHAIHYWTFTTFFYLYFSLCHVDLSVAVALAMLLLPERIVQGEVGNIWKQSFSAV